MAFSREIAHASKTHREKRPRSGFHGLRRQLCLELDRRHIAERRVQAFLVVDFFQELADRSASFGQIPIFVAMEGVPIAAQRDGLRKHICICSVQASSRGVRFADAYYSDSRMCRDASSSTFTV